MTRKNIKKQPQQLDLFQLQQEYPKEIVQNLSQEIDLEDLDVSKNVLICNVKRDNTRHFLNGTAKIYYTGKKFPSTIALNKLYYFMISVYNCKTTGLCNNCSSYLVRCNVKRRGGHERIHYEI